MVDALAGSGFYQKGQVSSDNNIGARTWMAGPQQITGFNTDQAVRSIAVV